MKKYSKLFTLAIAVFFGLTTITSAKVMTLDEFAKEVKKVDPVANDVYVFGEYAFTNSYLLDTQDIMIASRTVPASNLEEGYIYNENVKEDSVYQKMIAYKFKVVKEGGDFGTITGLTPVTNYVGEGKFNYSTIDVKYINYNYIALDAEYTVETDSTYNDYGFSGNLDSLKIENGYLTGIVKMTTLSEGTFSADETTGYYFALDLKIKNYDPNKTTVKITGLKEKTFKSSDFTGSDKITGNGETTLKFLLSLNPDKTKQFKIEVDLDGDDETLYGPTEYIIDLTSDKLVYQDYSEAALSLETNLPADELYGFEKSAKSNYYLNDCTGDENAKTCKIGGTVVKVPINKEAGYGVTAGWFIPLTFDPTIDTTKVTVKGGSQDLTLTEVGDTATILLRVTKDDSTHQRTYTIDLDGDGDEYLPIKYTVDWSDLNFAVDTEKVVIDFINSLNNKNNTFYTAIYNEKDGSATINLKLDSFKNITDIKSTGITGGIYNALKTSDYDKITFEYDSSRLGKHDFIESEAGTDSYKENGDITNAFNALIATMMGASAEDLSRGDYSKAIPSTITNKSFKITFDLKDGLNDVGGHTEYTVYFTTTVNTDSNIENAISEIKGQDYFSIIPEKDSAGKVVAYNVLIDDSISDLSSIEGTDMMNKLEELLKSQLYSEVKIGDITTIKLNDVNPSTKSTVKGAIIDYLKGIISSSDVKNISALKDTQIDVTLTLNTGVTDKNAVDGKLVYTFKLDVKKNVDVTGTIETESEAFSNQYYNQYEAKVSEKVKQEGNMYVHELEDTEKDAFYMNIGNLGAGVDPEFIVVNGVSIARGTKTTISIGHDVFLRAPIWVVEENGNLLVSVSYMNISAMPGTNTLISVGDKNFDVKLFDNDLSNKKLELTNVESLHSDADKTYYSVDDIITNDAGEYVVNIKYTKYNIPFLFHISLGGEEIKGQGLNVYTLDLNSNGGVSAMGFTSGEETAAYGCYFPWVIDGGTVEEDGDVMHWVTKIAIPSKGVITLNITVQAVTSLD